MRLPKLILPFALPLLAAAVAQADELYLSDGRILTGSVTVENQTVYIRMPSATLSFPAAMVLQVEYKPTPHEEFAQRLSAMASDDLEGMLGLARWAESQDMPKESRQLLDRIIERKPDSEAARAMLGQVKIDGAWQDFDKAIDLAKGKMEAGQLEPILKDILPRLDQFSANLDKRLASLDLKAQVLLRGRDFAQAATVLAKLAELSPDKAKAARYQAMADILNENSDGMYVLQTAEPPSAALLGSLENALPAGPASLSRPQVMDAALRAKARTVLAAARAAMDAGRQAEATDADAAKANYTKAAQGFDKADALVSGIAGSYRIELARRRILQLRKAASADAERYDTAMERLGRTNMSPQEYQTAMLNMVHMLDGVRDNLKAVLETAKPHARELVMEIKWAENDLQQIERRRKVLLDELSSN